jgi:hypothetical protein
VRVVLQLVVLRTGGVGVVGDLVVVEDDDPRVPLVGRLLVGVGLVERVPHAVVLEADRLDGRLVVADADQRSRPVPVTRPRDAPLGRVVAVLVDVVPEVQHRVEVVPGGQPAVGGEEAARVVAAGHEGQPQRVPHARLVWRRLSAAHGDVAPLLRKR